MTDKLLDQIGIEEEVQQSYLDYAMSVIVGRALPDVRDGLKPVHRRVLYAMYNLKNDWNKPYKKSARVVGDVIGKYHPHGDKAVYDTIVRMAQDFSMRYILVDGQGNFGSVDGDLAAAMRYTEVRLARIAQLFLDDLDKETVDFSPNYDNSEEIPDVLPTLVPNLLVNGSSGIAVGMATNIPTHNLAEVIDGCLALIEDPTLTVKDLMKHIPAPDFPTGAFISKGKGIAEAYQTGRGGLYMRAKYRLEEKKEGRVSIIVEEIPYRVNKAVLLEKIGQLVNAKKLDSIADLRDETNKEGMRIVIELRRDAVPDVVINNLFRHTDLECRFSINMVALVDGRPRLLNLKSVLNEFIKHRRDVVTRRTIYLLKQARLRGHILEGLALALAYVDRVIKLIKASATTAEAKQKLLDYDWDGKEISAFLHKAKSCRPDDLGDEYGLIKKKGKQVYKLSPRQVQAILDLRLQRLTSMEQKKLKDEYKEVLRDIHTYEEILSNPDKLRAVMRKELEEVKERYGDPRRSQIIKERREFSMMELIKPEEIVVLLSEQGYIKAQLPENFRVQKRGGMGKTATNIKEGDFVNQLVTANSHDTLLCFSNLGRVFWLKCYEIPQLGRLARGKPIINFIPLTPEERIVSILPWLELRSKDKGQEGEVSDKFIVIAMADGRIKRMEAQHFARSRRSGLNIITMNGGELVAAIPTDGKEELLIVSSSGLAIKTAEKNFRPQGRAARGVRGMRLDKESKLVTVLPTRGYDHLLTVSATGLAKCTTLNSFSSKGRGGKGMVAMGIKKLKTSLVGACVVKKDDEIMLVTSRGRLIRTPVKGVSVQGRSARGVVLTKMDSEDEHIKSLAVI